MDSQRSDYSTFAPLANRVAAPRHSSPDGTEHGLRRRLVLVLAVFAVSAVVVGVLSNASLGTRDAQSSLATAAAAADDRAWELRVSNAYERQSGIRIADGLLTWKHLVAVHTPTRLELVAPAGVDPVWIVRPAATARGDGAEHTANGTVSLELTFTAVGWHTVDVRARGGAAAAAVGRSFDVMAKYVRREIRTMYECDREAFLDALSSIYSIPQAEGEARFGAKYRSVEYLVAEHLRGAASKECDHWHDDAGIMTHHMAFTLELEQSLQAIDERVAVPYWDFTIDSYELGSDWPLAAIFQEEWFGSPTPNNAEHAVSNGRWAYTPIAREADVSFVGAIKNPYGLLRSPWNTNPTPLLTRYRYTLGVEDGGFSLPSCAEFNASFHQHHLSEILSDLNGLLHGPVHIMTGGQWFLNATMQAQFYKLFETVLPEIADDVAGNVLLSSKFLWRQGFVRCPEACSRDTPAADCSCSCPAAIVGDRTALEVLNATGLSSLNHVWLKEKYLAEANLSHADVFDVMCHVGHAGEMFTSAAPYDPLFWPLHGVAERFLSLRRLAAIDDDRGMRFDETWAYEHLSNLPSDTDTVCDWAAVDGGGGAGMARPTCVRGTCPGHHEDDLLPMGNFLGRNETYTNGEYYLFMAPNSEELPYTYDSLSTWPACTAQGFDFWSY